MNQMSTAEIQEVNGTAHGDNQRNDEFQLVKEEDLDKLTLDIVNLLDDLKFSGHLKMPQPEIDDKYQKMFSFVAIGGCSLPVIKREGVKLNLIPLRIVLYAVFGNKAADFVRQDVIQNCIKVEQIYSVNEMEADFLNQINFFFRKCLFGLEPFKCGDKMISMTEATDCAKFFFFVKRKFCNKPDHKDTENYCGFVAEYMDAKKQLMPYIQVADGRYIPFCALKLNLAAMVNKEDVMTINGWDLTYLTFCCKLAGITQADEAYELDVVPIESFSSLNKLRDMWPLFLAQNFLKAIDEIEDWMLDDNDDELK